MRQVNHSEIGRCWGLSLGIMTLVTFLACNGTDQPFGSFSGNAQAELLPDGRRMKLLADFAYTDAESAKWDAKKDAIVDGASIPQAFWSFIGGPFEGEYRNASIVHDVACQKKDRDWRAVHRMFYNACRCGGVSEFKAKLMYAAVYHFGPRWGEDQEAETVLSSEDDYERLQLLISTEPDVKIKQIEQLTPQVLRRRVPTLPSRTGARDLALPHFRTTFDRTGREIRTSGDPGKLELPVRTVAEKKIAERQLREARFNATTSVAKKVADLEERIASERDPQQRAVLATQLLKVNRERAAVVGVKVQIKIDEAPGP